MFENFTPIPAFLGGVLIGLASIGLWLGIGRIAGISGILERGLFLWQKQSDGLWSFWFLVGLILGGFILQEWDPTVFGFGHPHPLFFIVLGGFLVGLGSRLGSGCTSGHGVCGLGRLSFRSLVAVLTFMGTAFLTLILKRFFE